MINNFEKLRKFLTFEDDGDFYFIQILKRRKDNPTMKKDMVWISDFYIYSFDDYDLQYETITKTCEAHNARAYFRYNKRNAKKIALQMLKRVTDVIISEDYKNVKRCYSSVCGEFHSDKDKKWVIDYDYMESEKPNDWKDTLLINDIKEIVTELQKETKKEPLIELIESKNGLHIITRPFNLQVFKEKYPTIDVHKDNMSILYCP